jgi:hypothetical protein
LAIANEEARLFADLNITNNELAYALNLYDQSITELRAAYEHEENK